MTFNLDKLTKKADKATNEELLEAVATLLSDDRVRVGTALLKDEDGLITGTKVLIVCEDCVLEGKPAELSWPLQPLPIPDAFKQNNPERFN